ncbi:GlsB/YeaQ/YmgE family stress response membrane protein [Actinoplanes sp. TRM 88003]|uniref:GlsB/YeaQ/YmgE family stress response membrane protein n=1 Tax=Paractinoplanes aksuensis TaxID=2939490 RepID=A0ABT1E3D8_9ACTN|nr:GlsB/YeaQ/YmgE family stress response membrane protein [Actinoplanes aksuensis]MCO8277653.1 GlsB/YeaQ/YmgE family stress response membrane protein [Actinoplanes aksuensis]
MTVSSLFTAVAVGIVVGLGGRWIVPAGRTVPFWLPLSVAVGAAVFATVIARALGVDASQVSAVEVVMQVAFAISGVALVATTADQRRDDARRSR